MELFLTIDGENECCIYNINSELCVPTFYLIQCILFTNVPIWDLSGLVSKAVDF